MRVKEELKKMVDEAASRAGFDLPNILISKSDFGDYSTQAALTIKNGKKPSENSRAIIKNLPKNEMITRAEEKNGFINFELSQSFLVESVKNILKAKEKFGRNPEGKGESIQVEFVSANPTGPLHLGNARGGPLGDVIANILEADGAKVEREFYVNDIGSQVMHFGETLLYWKKKGAKDEIEFPEKGYPGSYMQEIAKKIPDSDDVADLAKNGIDEMMDEIKESLSRIGIKYDKFICESEILSSGKTQKVIEELKKKGETKIKDGAIWFAGKNQKFLEDRECVLVRSDKAKTPTYYANDIAYHKDKFDRGFDTLIDVWGSNHYGHMPRIKEALASLDLESDKLKILLYQYVRLKHGDKIERMAKREGIYVMADQVLDAVGKDAFRMMMLMNSPNTHFDFDLELAKKESKENPVYYLQYAIARIAGILRKNEANNETKRLIYKNKFEQKLIKELIKFPDLIEEISHSLEVHHLPHYGILLAKRFHQFYKNCPVIKAKNEKVKQSRLALIKATQIVLKNTLNLLGVNAPEKM
ncbi:MAG: arginine--tRNA ligase [Candidatus Berkelbacteria bacterium]|nr:arginine--tRNA ligase [Candidatus Berkelbacteria bacterium]